MNTDHPVLIQLIIAYTLVGAFVFTVVITCLSLIGWIRFANQKQQNRLFSVLIIQLVVIGLGVFSNVLQFDPAPVITQIEDKAIVDAHQTPDVQVRVNKLLDRVDALSDQQALKLSIAPPTSSPEIEQIIGGLDPQNARASHPATAKRMLKMRIVNIRRQTEELDLWERALSN